MEKKLKLVVVGDSYVGKTSLLFAYTRKEFVGDYNTTVFDNWTVKVAIEQKDYDLNIFDTAGQEDYAHLRCLSYPHTDVFLLCFSLVDPQSLSNCQLIWMPEIRKFTGDHVPVILVGTKQDLLDKTAMESRVSLVEAARVAQKIGAREFLACSSLTHFGLKQVFDYSLLAAVGIQPPSEPSQCCRVL